MIKFNMGINNHIHFTLFDIGKSYEYEKVEYNEDKSKATIYFQNITVYDVPCELFSIVK